MTKRRRSYNKGNARPKGINRWQLRYQSKSKTVEATTQSEADEALAKWVLELRGAPKGSLTMNDLFDSYLAHLRRNDRTDIKTVEMRLRKYLRERVGSVDARRFGRDDIYAYIDGRKQDKTKAGTPVRNATINREVAIITAARWLAADRLPVIAPIAKLPEDDGVRQGIVSEDVYRQMLRELPAHAQLFWVFGYHTGVRKGELLKLRWEWVDWADWMIRVPGWFQGERITKNGKRHLIPVYGDMREFLKSAYALRNAANPCLFQRQGACIKSFRTAFEEARKRLGLPHILFHDLRRTAATNLGRQGYREFEIQQVTGHKSVVSLRRYFIAEDHDMSGMVERLETQSERLREEKRAIEEKKYGQDMAESVPAKASGPSRLTTAKYKQ